MKKMSLLETVKSWTLGPWARRKEKKKVTVALWGSAHPVTSEICSHLLGTPGTYRRRMSSPFEERLVEANSRETTAEGGPKLPPADEREEDCLANGEAAPEAHLSNGRTPALPPDDLLCGEDVFFDAMEDKPPLEGPDEASDEVLYIVSPVYKDPDQSAEEVWRRVREQLKDVWDEIGLMEGSPRPGRRAIFVKRTRSFIPMKRRPFSPIVKRSNSGERRDFVPFSPSTSAKPFKYALSIARRQSFYH